MMRVALFIPAGHGYVDVMRVDGATLARREQEGAFLRLAFELADEPAEGCPDACFVFDTVGPLPPPVAVTCTLNVRDELELIRLSFDWCDCGQAFDPMPSWPATHVFFAR